MDVLRKELNGIYAGQRLGVESLDPLVIRECCERVRTAAGVDHDIRVITDASSDTCYIYGGASARLLGLGDGAGMYCGELDSSDEDVIYNRIHPEDLVEKRMLEYEFLKFVDRQPCGGKSRWKATCRIRIRDIFGRYMAVDNSTQIFRESPGGKIWLILCCYSLSPFPTGEGGISPRIVDRDTGIVTDVILSDRRSRILTGREREILLLIREGKLSKEIADLLGISVNTVSRHRQNILAKLSVGNSLEAVMAATAMKLL